MSSLMGETTQLTLIVFAYILTLEKATMPLIGPAITVTSSAMFLICLLQAMMLIYITFVIIGEAERLSGDSKPSRKAFFNYVVLWNYMINVWYFTVVSGLIFVVDVNICGIDSNIYSCIKQKCWKQIVHSCFSAYIRLQWACLFGFFISLRMVL